MAKYANKFKNAIKESILIQLNKHLIRNFLSNLHFSIISPLYLFILFYRSMDLRNNRKL